MSQQNREGNASSNTKLNLKSVQLQDQTHNVSGNDALKNIKIYIPTESYDRNMTFEENLAEGRIELFSKLPTNALDKTVHSIQKSSTEIQQSICNQTTGGIQDQKNLVSHAIETKEPTEQSSAFKTPEKHSNFSHFTDSTQQIDAEGQKHHWCDVCYKTFTKRRDLALHYLTHSEKEKKRASKATKKCDVCRKAQCFCSKVAEQIYPGYSDTVNYLSITQPINSKAVFIKKESHSEPSTVIVRELHPCPECDLSYGLESQLKQHALVHKRERAKREHPKKYLDCSSCSKKFVDNSSLMFHVVTVHPDNILPVSDSQNSAVDNSQRFPSNILEPQICSSCHTIFNTVIGLQKHLKRLGWVCDTCNTYFCLKKDFNTHLLTHYKGNTSNTKGAETTHCKSYKKVADIKGAEPQLNKCKICSRNFKYPFLLKQHALNHNRKKDHFCYLCKRKYKHKKNLHLHYFSHRKNNNPCLVCKKQFFFKNCAQVHCKTHLLVRKK